MQDISRAWPRLAGLAAVIVFTLLIGAAPAQGRDVNLAINPGLEEVEDDSFIGWSRYATEGSTAGLQISTDALDGEYAALIDIAAALAASEDTVARLAFTQRHYPVAGGGLLEPGATYRLSVYYRTEGDPLGMLMVQIKDFRPFPSLQLPPSDDWRYAELEFEFPVGYEWASIGVWANYNRAKITSGKIWFDNVELVKVEP